VSNHPEPIAISVAGNQVVYKPLGSLSQRQGGLGSRYGLPVQGGFQAVTETGVVFPSLGPGQAGKDALVTFPQVFPKIESGGTSRNSLSPRCPRLTPGEIP
jgi:hypothetical protein